MSAILHMNSTLRWPAMPIAVLVLVAGCSSGSSDSSGRSSAGGAAPSSSTATTGASSATGGSSASAASKLKFPIGPTCRYTSKSAAQTLLGRPIVHTIVRKPGDTVPGLHGPALNYSCIYTAANEIDGRVEIGVRGTRVPVSKLDSIRSNTDPGCTIKDSPQLGAHSFETLCVDTGLKVTDANILGWYEGSLFFCAASLPTAKASGLADRTRAFCQTVLTAASK